jgi:hypothetical protein
MKWPAEVYQPSRRPYQRIARHRLSLPRQNRGRHQLRTHLDTAVYE